MNMKIILRMIN